MKICFFFLWAMVVTVRCAALDKAELRDQLVSACAGNFYVDLLAEQALKDVGFQELKVDVFLGAKVYRCQMVKPGVNQHDFIFFLPNEGARRAPVILTESPDGVSRLVRLQPSSRLASASAEVLLRAILDVIRPHYTAFSIEDGTGAALKKQGVDVKQGISVCIGQTELDFTGNVVCRIGATIKVWSIYVAPGCGASVTEVLNVNVAEWAEHRSEDRAEEATSRLLTK